ncbi:MAG: glycoside hydrolase family 3 protein, partial [Cellulomonas sp.]
MTEHRTPTRDATREAHVDVLLARLTLHQKVRLLTGADFWSLHPEPAVGLRTVVVSDGPSGVRGAVWDERDPSLNLPSATALAATWDPDLAYRYGVAMAHEARRKGVDVILGPTINLHRSPLGGRHFEAYSEDPLLTADIAEAFVRGVQDTGIGACPKHYVANDFETDRFTASVAVSDRALHELYLAPFERTVVDAGTWTVMSAYNAVGGVTMSENDLLAEP